MDLLKFFWTNHQIQTERGNFLFLLQQKKGLQFVLATYFAIVFKE